MSDTYHHHLSEILLVEDSPTDAMMTIEAFSTQGVRNPIHLVENGGKALAYLKRQDEYASARRPGLIILDLNLPGLSGREVLAVIKDDPELRKIPIVILTTSQAEDDVVESYLLNANCYVVKPVDFTRFEDVVKGITDFWFRVVTLPPEVG